MTEDNQREQAQKLLKKYLKGECNPEEERMVIEWFFSFEEEPILPMEEKEAVLGRSKKALLHKFESEVNTAKSTRKLFTWKRMAIAASILFALTTTVILLKQKPTTTVKQIAAITADTSGMFKNDILPGGRFAKLSNASGQTQLLGNENQDENSSPAEFKGNLTLEVPMAGTYSLVLSDGTTVWLNAASKLEYPDQFAGNERRVKLVGEAFFKVAKDASKPFRIEVENSVIEVLGTSFNVNAYHKEISTSLVEGKVKIISQGHEAYLSPGNEAIVSTNNIRIQPADIQKNTAWQRGEFLLDGNSLEEIISQVSRWYNVDFVNAEEIIALDNRFSGTLSRDARLSEVLKILAYTTNRKFEIEGRQIFIR
ncbi:MULTISPECIES: FecR family protein [unclassified Sphingobacterium]|uniref:FecR family protein n=1 Tax=unclassified Sphingobacterium TaxID=2609468 RepID=UPI0029554B6F|nr:FecR family protein [Sphingobacterium sp. UGAL515B_05]WON92574.1 FecR domain-containing protein [Sphingobacterium sp. UGAL515B_05]